MENRDPLLSFDDFLMEKNNFGLHFMGPVGENLIGDLFREQSWYRSCAKMHPELVRLTEELCRMMLIRQRRDALMGIFGRHFARPEFIGLEMEMLRAEDRESVEYLGKLYDAYVLMHPYASTNWGMFA